jgi:hypothetical protein
MAYHILQWEVIWPLCQIVKLRKIAFIKPHCPTIKAQKTTRIQLLCNYPSGIVIIVQLSP